MLLRRVNCDPVGLILFYFKGVSKSGISNSGISYNYFIGYLGGVNCHIEINKAKS